MCTLPWERHMVAELILSSAAENPTSFNRLLGRWSFCAYFSLRGWPFPQFVLPLCYLLSYVSANSVTNPPGNTVLASDDEILEKQPRVSFRHTGMEITVLVSWGHRRAGSSWASALPCDGTPELTARSHAATPRHWTLISLRGAQGYKLLLHQRDCFFFLSIDKKGKREKSTARDASAVPMPHVSPSFPGAAIRPTDPRAAACAEGAPNAIAADREAAGGAPLRAAVSPGRSRPPGGPTEQLPRAARRMPLTCWFLGRTPSGQRRVTSPCGGRRSRLRARRAPASVLLLGAARCGLESRRPSDSFGWQLPRFTFLAEIERGGRAQPPALPAPTRRAPLRARHPQPGTPSPVPDSSEAKRGSGRAHRGGKAPAEEGGYRPHRTYPYRPRHLSSGYRGVGVTHTRSSALHVRGSNRGRFSITWHAGVRFGQAVVARYVRSALESVPG